MKNFKRIFLAMLLTLQFALPQAVFAAAENVLFNFETDHSFTPSAGPSTVSYVKGQYGKAADDTSYRMSTDGADASAADGTSSNYEWGSTYGDSTLPYLHYSMEFLPEDRNSGVEVKLAVRGQDNHNAWQLLSMLDNRANPEVMQIAGGAASVGLDIGDWNKIDLYFEKEGSAFTVFKNGKYAAKGTLPASYVPVNYFSRLQIWHYVKKDAENKSVKSAVQFDNILFERVAKVPNPKVFFDFETSDQMAVTATDIGTVSYVKGQYVKSAGDTSIRMSTNGEEASKTDWIIRNEFKSIPGDATLKYIHYSMEFLQEDAKSGILVRLVNSKDWKPTVMLRTNKANPKTVIMANEQVSADQNIGIWNKVDMYFEVGTPNVTVFMNGNKYSAVLPEGDASNIIGYFSDIRISQEVNVTDNRTVPSAVQFDNIVFERVAEIPEAQDYRHIGEILDFDDGCIINEWDSPYIIPSYSGDKIVKLPKTGNPSVVFGQNQNDDHVIEGGYGGQPAWNKSLHSKFAKADDAYGDILQGLQYRTGVTDLKAGDYGHLTFKLARIGDSGNPNVYVRSKSSTMKYSDSSTNSADINLCVLAWNGTTFFDQSADITIPRYQWAKIDMIFKIGNGVDTYTKVDCYVDGVKKISDYELKAADGNYAVLNYIGDIYFISGINKDYMVDDLGFGVFGEETMYDPTKGYSITATDTALSSRIDNSKNVIVLPDDYSVEEFKSKVNVSVTVYNAEGEEVIDGTMGAATVEVSNGFGGGKYYEVTSYVFREAFDNSVDNLKIATEVPAEQYKAEYVAGVGGKNTDEKNLQLGLNEDAAVQKELFIRGGVGPFAAESVLYELNARPISGETEISITPNGLSQTYRQPIVKFMPTGEIRIMGNEIILDEQWVKGQWYKIAAAMESGTNNIKVYLNGENVYDGEYVGIDGFAGFENLSFVQITVYKGECGFDDMRIGYNTYKPEADLITSKDAETVVVNNAESIIGFAGGVSENITAEVLKEKVTNDILTYNNGTAFVRKGDTIKYFKLGYKTKEFGRPVIEVDENNNVTATAALKDTAKLEEIHSDAAVYLAVYDSLTGRLENAVFDNAENTHIQTENLSAAINNCITDGKFAKAFLWDGFSMEALKKAKSLEFVSAEETE